MDEKDYLPAFKDIDLRWYPTGESLRVEEVVGMAVARNADGYATTCFCSDGKRYDFPKDIEEFFNTADDRAFFVSGVDRELEPILKWLGPQACENLLDGFPVQLGNTQLTYHGSLATRIAGGKSLRRIWAVKPFYPATMLAEEDDCYGVQALGERLIKTLLNANLPLHLTSCGSLLSGLSRLPFCSGPREALDAAYNAYHGGWIEAMKLGSFPHAYDYDLSSAYPTETAKLIDCGPKCGFWVESTKVVAEAYYGFCWCEIHMDLNLPFSPIMLRTSSRMSGSGRYPIRSIRNPVGEWQGWLTIDEVKFIVKNWLGRVTILAGWWFIPTRYRRPFMGLVGGLNSMRWHYNETGDKLGAYISKITAAAIQGKFMQSFVERGVRRAGNALNPVYAATITSRVRLKVAEIAYENIDDVLMIMVDGLLMTKPVAVPKQWKLAHTGQCVVANHGDYDIPGREVTSSLREALMKDELNAYYTIKAPRYVSLTEALEGQAFWAAGRRRPEVTARVSRVGKRGWPKLPKLCRDLLREQYESYPLLPSMRGAEIP